ncbi:methyl-accepting chemotaxis protein [Paenibacillus ferrarius]|uniref:methyl-accepting chemotaxis protein n=1 Tax=Paenibacillus ferrarius TaxID=1469647 RepID=UPI003D2CF9DE
MKLSVRLKFGVVFGVIVLMLAVMCLTDLTRMHALKNQNEKVANDWMMGIQQIEEINYNSEHLLMLYYQKKLEPDVKKHEPIDTKIASTIEIIDQLLGKYKESIANGDDQAHFDQLTQNWTAFKDAFAVNKKMAADPTKVKEAADSLAAMSTAFGNAQKTMAEMVDFNKEGGQQAVQESNELYRSSVATSIVVVVILLLIMLTAGYLVDRLIVVPVRKASQALNRIAEGDLTVQTITVKNQDEIGALIGSVNRMVGQLRLSVEKMLNASNSVAASSQQLFASSEQNTSASQHVAVSVQEFANGADVQAQSSEECGRAMEEMAVGISRIAETTADVSELSMTASQLADRGTHAMERVVNKMQAVNEAVQAANGVIQELEKHSQSISQMSTLIGDIAAQTNLLALNAAIEAARAGESGKGFAVVAGEVRKLSTQTDDSVRSISALISSIQTDTQRAVAVMNTGLSQVQDGLTEVGTAEQAFDQIVQASQEVASKIQETAAAAQQMAASTEEVAATVAQVGNVAKMTSGTAQSVAAVTQQQLASAEEITSSAKSLAEIATDLNAVVNGFRLA